MNAFYSLLLVAVSLALGIIYGETCAPISGVTVQALARRTSQLEEKLAELNRKYDLLAVEISVEADTIKR